MPQLFARSPPAHTILRFRRLIRMLPTPKGQRGDPFSQPSGSSALWDDDREEEPLSNRKERTGFLPPGSLRLGFVGQPFFYHACPLWQARAFTIPAPIPPSAGPENLQCRAAFIHDLRAVVPMRASLLPGSNPFLTRGTVASPTKLSLSCTVAKWVRAADSNHISELPWSNPIAG